VISEESKVPVINNRGVVLFVPLELKGIFKIIVKEIRIMKLRGIMNTVVVLILLLSSVCVHAGDIQVASAAPLAIPGEDVEKMEDIKEDAARAEREAAAQERMLEAEMEKAQQGEIIDQLTFPEDDSPNLNVKEIAFQGNTLLSDEELLAGLPLVFNDSAMSLLEAPSDALYDFRGVGEIAAVPGSVRGVSARTVNGLTKYVLSAYQSRNYAGIFVHVPRETMQGGNQLVNDVLVIRVVEYPVTSVRVSAYDVDANSKPEPLLKREIIEEWSPAKPGQMANSKEIDEFVNLLNLNPDRYVSATISRGAEPNSLAVGYDIYETSPWHFYIQIDNAGTKDKQWSPRFGIINTNVTGRDDMLMLMYQSASLREPKRYKSNFAVYGSYEFPVWTPRVRLQLFAGISRFYTPVGTVYNQNQPLGSLNFLGNGSFYGGKIKVNVLQVNKWMFDLTGGYTKEFSKISNNLIPLTSGEDHWDFWSYGFNIHHRDDMSETSIALDHYISFDEGIDGFDGGTFVRTNIHKDMQYTTFSANHEQNLDEDAVGKVVGKFRYIDAFNRLHPAKMTTFGGLYSVRGYPEDQVVGDEGYLWSIQYEHDLIASDKVRDREAGIEPVETEEGNLEFKRLAPVLFVDGAHAAVIDSVVGEKSDYDFLSFGTGVIGQLGDNLSGEFYYGWPLKSSTNSNVDGEYHLSFKLVW